MIPNLLYIQLCIPCWYVSTINFKFLLNFVFLIIYPQ